MTLIMILNGILYPLSIIGLVFDIGLNNSCNVFNLQLSYLISAVWLKCRLLVNDKFLVASISQTLFEVKQYVFIIGIFM